MFIFFLVLLCHKIQSWTYPLAMRAVPQSACECDAQVEAQRRDRVRHVTLRALDFHEGCNPRERQALGVGRSFF